MISRRIIMICLVSLTGCQLEPFKTELSTSDFAPAKHVSEPKPPKRIVTIPKALPLPGQLKKLDAEKTKKPKRKNVQHNIKTALDSTKDKARIEPVKDGYINAIQVYPYTKGALYKLYTAVNQMTDITLQPGEQLISISAGDTARWIIGDTTSGSGASERIHIRIKPTHLDLSTNLIINTNKRTYFLELESQTKAYMASVSWTYPQDEIVAIKHEQEKINKKANLRIAKDVSLNNLNFNYTLRGDAPWKPIRAFDDGKKVYIQFAKTLSRSQAPPLFVRAASGKPALLNYRVKGTYYIVDQLFTEAQLRLGENPQSVVRIIRKNNTWEGDEPW
ncbi:MAG: P-type conjugative transfer protein TrbG [Pseudomonadota bacterium]